MTRNTNRRPVALTPDRRIVPVVPITGPAFSPDGTRLHCNSQRGPRARRGSGLPVPGPNGAGITYEVRGPLVRKS